MKLYIVKRAIISLELAAAVCIVPFAMSLMTLGQKNGYMLMLMIICIGVIVFTTFMLPCIRFYIMICSQEKKGYQFVPREVRVLSKTMGGTYLGSEWLIYAGSVALHYTQCKTIRGVSNKYGRIRYSIIVETIGGRTYEWPLSRQNVKSVQDWLLKKDGKTEQLK